MLGIFDDPSDSEYFRDSENVWDVENFQILRICAILEDV